ncbi:MAG: hypothetical protein SGJ20_21525 [Planctomycetota bacterium]|nr:hypothetical protein [Planctomycetota bacterium]
MTTTKKNAAGLMTQAARMTIHNRNSIIKQAIIRGALWGVIPIAVATWLIRRLHLGAA